MPRRKLLPYHCPRCGYEIAKKSSMVSHFTTLKKPCPSIENDIDLTKEIKDYVLANKIYKIPKQDKNKQQATSTANEERIKKLEFEIEFMKNKKKETFYQKIVENYLQGSHKKLLLGVTDVTNDRVHAEIKKWECFAHAVGQLTIYNVLDPKEELQIYLFGKTNKKTTDHIIKLLTEQKFVVHTFKQNVHSVTIHCHNTNQDVFEYIIE